MTAGLRTGLGIVISLLFLYLAVRNVDFKLAAGSVSGLDWNYLALCVFCQAASLFTRAALWQNILSYEKSVSYRHAFESLIIGYMGNNILPFRMGEAMRAFAMGRKEKISRTLAFASVILERLYDLFTLLLFFAVLVFLMTLDRRVVLSAAVVSIFLGIAVLFLYLIASDFLKVPSRVFKMFLRLVPAGRHETAERIIGSFVRGIILVRTLRQALVLLGLSVLAWTLWTAILYFGLKAFHLDLPLTATILMTVVVHIGVMIPSSPGFIGVFQWLCIFSLSFFGVPKEIALTFSLIVHMIQYIPTTLLGWWYLTRMHVTGYRSLKEELDRAGAAEGG